MSKEAHAVLNLEADPALCVVVALVHPDQVASITGADTDARTARPQSVIDQAREFMTRAG
jgi:hypothetical protein